MLLCKADLHRAQAASSVGVMTEVQQARHNRRGCCERQVDAL